MKNRPRQLRAARPAMTLLEVVLAVSLLVLVASLITTTLGQIELVETRDRKRMGAYEAANRLMLQYLDDADQLPADRTRPIEYGPWLFAWTLDEEPVRMVLDEERRERSGQNAQMLDRFVLVTITIWEAEDTGTGGVRRIDEPLAQLARMYDPFVMRNPDAMVRFGDNQDNITRLLQRILGLRPAEPDQSGDRGRGSGRGGRERRRDRR